MVKLDAFAENIEAAKITAEAATEKISLLGTSLVFSWHEVSTTTERKSGTTSSGSSELGLPRKTETVSRQSLQPKKDYWTLVG